jgi:CheY-like chemotaxis protein
VLIVDDEPVGRETLEALLLAEGYQLAFAANGPEALAQAAALNPDVILLDVMMPGMDGFEVCRRLRASPAVAEVPVIFDARLRGIEAGADDFVIKPYDRAELRLRVRTIIRLNRYRRLHAERLRLAWAIEQADDGYVILEVGDRIASANPRAAISRDPRRPAASHSRYISRVGTTPVSLRAAQGMGRLTGLISRPDTAVSYPSGDTNRTRILATGGKQRSRVAGRHGSRRAVAGCDGRDGHPARHACVSSYA